MTEPWTPQDRKRLRELYVAGASFQTMCRLLNRTKTALNKVLARTGIRPKRVQPPLYRKNDEQGTNPQRLWVSLETVVAYLEKQGFRITPSPNPHQGGKLTPSHAFTINRDTCSSLKLLFVANRHRYEKSLPPYVVAGVTWI
jgi:hypothetical protein